MPDDAFAATLDPRQAPPGDALAARGGASADPLSADYQQTVNDIRGSMADRTRTLQQREQALEGPRSQAIQQLRQPVPQPPQQQQLPPTPKRNEPGADESWLAVAGVLGAIAGGLTRNHATNALAAMTGAMEGYNEGSKQKFDQNLKLWDAESKKILETNRQANEAYTQILQSNKLALEQKSMEIQMMAAKYDDRAAMQLAQTKDFETLGRLIQQRMDKQQQLQHWDAQLRQQHEQFIQREGTANARQQETERHNKVMEGQGQEQQMEARAQAIAAGKLAPINNPRNPQDRALMGRVMEINPDYSAARYQGDVAGERSGGVRLWNMENISRKLASVVPDTLAAEAAVSRTKFVPVNQAIQAVQRGSSDPALAAFATQNINLAELWARSQKPTGVLDVALQQRALENLNTATDSKAYRTIVNQIVREIQRETQATKEQRSGAPMTVPEVPGAFVPPGQKPLGGVPAVGGDLLGTIRSKLPQGWSVEPVQ